MKIVHLDKATVLENIDSLMKIDRVIIDEEGNWTLNNFLKHLNQKWDYSFAYFIENQIVGFIVCSIRAGNPHIHRFAVLPEYQGKGIGRSLLNHICNLSSNNHLKYVTLQVKKLNFDAQRYYEHHGFERIGLIGQNYVYKKVIE